MASNLTWERARGDRGSAVIFVAVVLILVLSIAALAIDVGYLYVVRGELQNAADSGALAGAQVLYNTDGTVNAGANAKALEYVQAHYSEQESVRVDTVERGHWSFATRTFTPNTSLAPVSLWGVSTAELDANTNFINAVRVITTRKTDSTTGEPEQPFFARVFGAGPAAVRAAAVAYIGFAGTLMPGEADQPIAICQQALLVNGQYTCTVGRMINSGSGNDAHQTGGWTNFDQSPACATANANDVRPLVCGSSGNVRAIQLGVGMGTVGGQQQSPYDRLLDCWNAAGLDTDGDGIPDQPWQMTLPVIDCPGNNTGNCSIVVGAVTMNVVWITRTDSSQMDKVPKKMAGWSCPSGYTNQQCWNDFAQHFGLKDISSNEFAQYQDKTIYFLPDCTPHAPAGVTGGANFGILAKIPVLVH